MKGMSASFGRDFILAAAALRKAARLYLDLYGACSAPNL